MDHILAYLPSNPTLFRFRVDSYPTQKGDQTFNPARIATHLATDHPPTQPPLSSAIADSLFSHQIGLGLNSDRLLGRFLSDFNPSQDIHSLNYPTVGAAWNYFKNGIVSFAMIAPAYPSTLRPDGKPFLSLADGSFITYSIVPSSELDYSFPYPKYRLIQPTQINTPAVCTPTSTTLAAGFAPSPTPGVWEANVAEIPNRGSFTLSFQASVQTQQRTFWLNADSFDPTDPLLFKESEFAAYAQTQAILDHINTVTHYGIDDDALNNTSCYSAAKLSRYNNAAQRLQMTWGGDAWLQSDLSNKSHPIEPLPDGTMVYWVAHYNGAEAGKRVRHPNGTILAAPVNGKKRIRCAFYLPAEIMPIADEGVLLRRCNPTLGYTPGLA